MPEPANYQCPHCDATIEATPTLEAQFVTCPNCGKEVEIPAAEIELNATTELDRNRIRQLAAERRASMRTRSYCLIAAIVCAVAAIELAMMATSEIHKTGVGPLAVTEIVFTILAVAALPLFLRSAK